MGIASPEGKIASYTNFTVSVLPRIKDLGKTWHHVTFIRSFAFLSTLLFCWLLQLVKSAQQSYDPLPLWNVCIFSSQEQRGSEALSWCINLPTHQIWANCVVCGKTIVAPSLSTLVHNPADMPGCFDCHCSFSSSIFSGRPVTLPLHKKTTSASQHPVYWHDLKGSLTIGLCFVKRALQHKLHHKAVMAQKLTACFLFHDLDSDSQ